MIFHGYNVTEKTNRQGECPANIPHHMEREEDEIGLKILFKYGTCRCARCRKRNGDKYNSAKKL